MYRIYWLKSKKLLATFYFYIYITTSFSKFIKNIYIKYTFIYFLYKLKLNSEVNCYKIHSNFFLKKISRFIKVGNNSDESLAVYKKICIHLFFTDNTYKTINILYFEIKHFFEYDEKLMIFMVVYLARNIKREGVFLYTLFLSFLNGFCVNCFFFFVR